MEKIKRKKKKKESISVVHLLWWGSLAQCVCFYFNVINPESTSAKKKKIILTKVFNMKFLSLQSVPLSFQVVLHGKQQMQVPHSSLSPLSQAE